ncbi:hypothetical protein ACTXJ8_01720 [Corynebacterium variabile]|uniref:hypothetical protein n=1 Tax=Corynebacterium variabile TaxID=1727 RepID=UPI003FD0E056
MMYSPDDLDALAGIPFDPDRPVDPVTLAASARAGVLVAGRRYVHAHTGEVAVDPLMAARITRVSLDQLSAWREHDPHGEGPDWTIWDGPQGRKIVYPTAGLWVWCEIHGLIGGDL